MKNRQRETAAAFEMGFRRTRRARRPGGMWLSALLGMAALVPALGLSVGPAPDRIVVLISLDGLAHYYMDDPRAEMPTIRRLAAEGARAERMKAVMPSVTWPIHTSLVTGATPSRHGVVGNTYLDREKNEVVPFIWDSLFDKEDAVRCATIYDVAKRAGLTTASVTWPCTRGAKTLDWTVPCVTSSELFVRHSTPVLLEEFKRAGIPYENEADGFKAGQGENRDRLHVRMFNHIVRAHRPQLALLHILEVDHVEHAHGPQTPEAYAAVKFVDGLVRDVWEELQNAFPGKATLLVVSDHGFVGYRQAVLPNVVLRKAGLLTTSGKAITGGPARAVSQGGGCLIYVTDRENRAALVRKIAALFKDVEGVSLVLAPEDFPKYGLADPVREPRMADIVLSAKEGYSFSDSAAGEDVVSAPTKETKGTHGYDPNEPKLYASFVAWGRGIRTGSNAGVIANTSVAPTIAALLGLKMESAEGAPLTAILEKPSGGF